MGILKALGLGKEVPDEIPATVEVSTGEPVKYPGKYVYDRHKDGGVYNCFVANKARGVHSPRVAGDSDDSLAFLTPGMYLSRGSDAPGTGSCPHDVVWQKSNVPLVINSYETFPMTGYYSYAGHAEPGSYPCYIPPQLKMMLFKKGEKAPPSGSCPHTIRYHFEEPFRKKF